MIQNNLFFLLCLLYETACPSLHRTNGPASPARQALLSGASAQLSGVSRARIAALESDKITDITFRNLLSILHALDLDLQVVALGRKRPTLEELQAEQGDHS